VKAVLDLDLDLACDFDFAADLDLDLDLGTPPSQQVGASLNGLRSALNDPP
jgi:hypothetical protein